MQNLTISPLSTLPQVRVLGRCAGTDPLTLFWTGSGIELLFTGSELWVELNADYDTMEPWVSVELDGAWISREELRENYTGNGIALTSEMIAEFAAGRDPYSLEAK